MSEHMQPPGGIAPPSDFPGLEHLALGAGKHSYRHQGVCLLEAVAWFAGESHTDRPDCACPVLATFGRSLNDLADNLQRPRLASLVPALAGSFARHHLTPQRRAYAIAQAAIASLLTRSPEHWGIGELRNLPVLSPDTNQEWWEETCRVNGPAGHRSLDTVEGLLIALTDGRIKDAVDDAHALFAIQRPFDFDGALAALELALAVEDGEVPSE